MHIFLTSGLAGFERSASRPDAITPRKETVVPIGYEVVWTKCRVLKQVVHIVTTGLKREKLQPLRFDLTIHE
jgi:hypothetical protein